MATMKDLLRAETLKVGSRGAMPSNQIIALVEKTNFTSPNGESVRYVAPCDGVLSAFLQATGRDSNATPGVGIVDGDGRRHAARTTDGSVHMNLRKGNSATANFYEAREHIDQWIVRFSKTIGGGHSRYLPTLSCNRFGGSIWLRLKTTSETLPRLGVASRSRVGKLLISNLSVRPRGVGSELTSHLLTGILSYGLMQRPMLLPKSFLAMPASSCHRILQRSGLDALSLVGRGKSVNTPCTVKGSFKERRCSFIPRVACNNARMEVAA